jgi:hypothetical protein
MRLLSTMFLIQLGLAIPSVVHAELVSHPITLSYCEQSPLDPNELAPEELLQDEVKGARHLSEEDKMRLASWRSLCGPFLRRLEIQRRQWNFHPGVCRFRRQGEKKQIISEGQISHALPWQKDTQYYFGFQYEQTDRGWELKKSYSYTSANDHYQSILEAAQDPTLIKLFHAGCDALKLSCPLPQSSEQMAQLIQQISLLREKAHQEGKSLFEALGIVLPHPVGIGSPQEQLPLLAHGMGLSCLQVASKTEASVGLNSTTSVVSLSEHIEALLGAPASQGPRLRVPLFGHHWNLYPPVVKQEQEELVVYGQISHNVAFNLDDQIYYTLRFKEGQAVGMPQIKIQEANLGESSAQLAQKIVELVNIYRMAKGQGELRLPPEALAMVATLSKESERLLSGDWKVAAKELSHIIAKLALEFESRH